MKNMKTRDLVLAGLFAALVFVGTYFFSFPLPSGIGYIHLGDTFVYLSGALLGPIVGAMAAGVGSSLSDLMLGYAQYAPVTFVIKALNAFIVGMAFKTMVKSQDAIMKKIIVFVISSAVAGVTMVFGYFLYETVLYTAAGAAPNIVMNGIQAGASLVFSTILYATFRSTALSNLIE